MLWDRRRNIVYDDAGVRAKWGVPPTSIPDWLGLVGDTSDGFPGLPGWGAKSAAAVLDRYGHYEEIPAKASAWEVPGVGGSRAIGLAATLRDHWDEALLYRDLARLRTVDDGVPIRQRDPDELRWDGAPRDAWEAFCEEWGLDRLRTRPASLARGLSRLADEREQRLVVRRRRGQDPDRLRAVARGRTTGRRSSRSRGRRRARR